MSHERSSQMHQSAAGAIAGLAAGALLSVAWYAIEKATGETSEVVRLGRLSLQTRGRARREAAPPDAEEQIMSHGGHLALSAAAGALYGLVTPKDAPRLLAGAGFGAVFYAVAYGTLAPVLGLRPAMWNDTRTNVAQRGFFHLLFGILVGWMTPAIARRS